MRASWSTATSRPPVGADCGRRRPLRTSTVMNPQRFGHKRTPAFVLAAFPQGAALLVLVAAALLAVGGGPAQVLPAYARQTGQPCAVCHTAFPELTPFGRRFKIGGYTLGGGDWK